MATIAPSVKSLALCSIVWRRPSFQGRRICSQSLVQHDWHVRSLLYPGLEQNRAELDFEDERHLGIEDKKDTGTWRCLFAGACKSKTTIPSQRRVNRRARLAVRLLLAENACPVLNSQHGT